MPVFMCVRVCYALSLQNVNSHKHTGCRTIEYVRLSWNVPVALCALSVSLFVKFHFKNNSGFLVVTTILKYCIAQRDGNSEDCKFMSSRVHQQIYRDFCAGSKTAPNYLAIGILFSTAVWKILVTFDFKFEFLLFVLAFRFIPQDLKASNT